LSRGGRRPPVVDLRAHFWEGTRLDRATGCLLWLKSQTKNGYGKFFPRNNGRCYLAHRYAAFLAGMASLDRVDPRSGCGYVLHRCRNRHCVNPRHLYVGTQKQNSRDRIRDGTHLEGERLRHAKLTNEAALQIRELCDEGLFTRRSLARVVGVSASTVGYIANRRRWRHIPEGDAMRLLLIVAVLALPSCNGLPDIPIPDIPGGEPFECEPPTPALLAAPSQGSPITIPRPVPNTSGAQAQLLSDVAGTRSKAKDRHDQRQLPLDGEFLAGIGNDGVFPDGRPVKVCVVDTGVSEHVDFLGRLQPGFSVFSGDPSDGHGHGTGVASVVLGNQFGIAPAAVVVPIRVLNDEGSGTDTGVIQGVDWGATRERCDVMNMSLGGTTSDALDNALRRAHQAGVAIAVAGGNDGLDACKYSPARNRCAFTAGATSARDTVPSWSNLGKCLEGFAVGEDVLMARLNGGETVNSGTSFSSPLIAGGLARLRGAFPGDTVDELYARLTALTTPDVVSLPTGTESPNRLLFVGADQ